MSVQNSRLVFAVPVDQVSLPLDELQQLPCQAGVKLLHLAFHMQQHIQALPGPQHQLQPPVQTPQLCSSARNQPVSTNLDCMQNDPCLV